MSMRKQGNTTQMATKDADKMTNQSKTNKMSKGGGASLKEKTAYLSKAKNMFKDDSVLVADCVLGTITRWYDGYGLIELDEDAYIDPHFHCDSQQPVYFRSNACLEPLQTRDAVRFDLFYGDRGLYATKVKHAFKIAARGKVVKLKSDFGFVKTEACESELYFKKTDLQDGVEYGSEVVFDILSNPMRNSKRAANIRSADPKRLETTLAENGHGLDAVDKEETQSQASVSTRASVSPNTTAKVAKKRVDLKLSVMGKTKCLPTFSVHPDALLQSLSTQIQAMFAVIAEEDVTIHFFTGGLKVADDTSASEIDGGNVDVVVMSLPWVAEEGFELVGYAHNDDFHVLEFCRMATGETYTYQVSKAAFSRRGLLDPETLSESLSKVF
jgi:cold shock CspA family protein